MAGFGLVFVPEEAFELALDGGVEISEDVVGGVRATETIVDADEDPGMLIGDDDVDAVLPSFALRPLEIAAATVLGIGGIREIAGEGGATKRVGFGGGFGGKGAGKGFEKRGGSVARA